MQYFDQQRLFFADLAGVIGHPQHAIIAGKRVLQACDPEPERPLVVGVLGAGFDVQVQHSKEDRHRVGCSSKSNSLGKIDRGGD